MANLLDVLDKAKALAKTDLTSAAKYLSQNAGMSETQAAENLSAYAQKREAVNTSSPTGLFQGSITPGNIAGAPTSVIASTASDRDKQAAQALSTLANLGTPGMPAPQTPAPSASVAPPQAQSFQYTPSTRSASQLDSEAKRQSQYTAEVQRQALIQALNRKLQSYDQSMTKLPQELNQAWARNDEEAARTGFYTSGRRFALRDKSNTAMQQNLADILSQKNFSIQEAGDAERAIAANQTQQYLNILDSLTRDERNFGLQDRAQQYSEFSGNRNYDLSAARTNSDLASAAFALSRNRQLLPYELEGAQLGNASQYLSNIGANLSNQTNQAQYNDLYNPSGIGYQMRQGQLTSQQLQTERARLDNETKALEYQIAANPIYGATAQAQLELDKRKKDLAYVDAQIASQNALTAQRGREGTGTSDADKRYEATRTANINSLTGMYTISRPGAELWQDFTEIISEGKSGKPYSVMEQEAIFTQMVSNANGLSGQDRYILPALWQSSQGVPGGGDSLLPYRKTQTPYEQK